MGTPPKPIRATAAKAVIKDPGLVFYKPAVRDAVSRGDLARMKLLLKSAKDIQKTGIDKMVVDLESAIAKAGK
ncbi:MAG TPA: DUF1843 domain-containing protein [Allosphingosinicella sp.]|jgi:hypothetical protein